MADALTLERICQSWEGARSLPDSLVEVACSSGIVLPGAGPDPRFCFVSAGSPLEQLVGGQRAEVIDRGGAPITIDALASRLLDGEVAAVLAPRGALDATPSASRVTLPVALLDRRQRIRQANVAMRFLLRQIGLEEVSSHRGADALLYLHAAQRWSLDLAMCTDVAMMLTLGADRQRYVDPEYNERATDRLPRALARLQDLGVRSYPRLVIV